uniref:DNA-directed primase/polymerase protein n=1 Tax=Trichogramma kaykai TaxID=54128 RepID=A0ABD2X7D1_9HYME
MQTWTSKLPSQRVHFLKPKLLPANEPTWRFCEPTQGDAVDEIAPPPENLLPSDSAEASSSSRCASSSRANEPDNLANDRNRMRKDVLAAPPMPPAPLYNYFLSLMDPSAVVSTTSDSPSSTKSKGNNEQRNEIFAAFGWGEKKLEDVKSVSLVLDSSDDVNYSAHILIRAFDKNYKSETMFMSEGSINPVKDLCKSITYVMNLYVKDNTNFYGDFKSFNNSYLRKTLGYSSETKRTIEMDTAIKHSITWTGSDNESKLDLNVYHYNQQFRLFGHSKFGQNRPLVIMRCNVPSKLKGGTEVTLKHCFVTIPIIKNVVLIDKLNLSTKHDIIQSIQSNEPISAPILCVEFLKGFEADFFTPPDSVEDNLLGNSPDTEIIRGKIIDHMQLIGYPSKILMNDTDGNNEKIYFRTNCKFCCFEQRLHKSNNVYYTYEISTGVLYQQCYDVKCNSSIKCSFETECTFWSQVQQKQRQHVERYQIHRKRIQFAIEIIRRSINLKVNTDRSATKKRIIQKMEADLINYLQDVFSEWITHNSNLLDYNVEDISLKEAVIIAVKFLSHIDCLHSRYLGRIVIYLPAIPYFGNYCSLKIYQMIQSFKNEKNKNVKRFGNDLGNIVSQLDTINVIKPKIHYFCCKTRKQ